jgi:hypothetical protein
VNKLQNQVGWMMVANRTKFFFLALLTMSAHMYAQGPVSPPGVTAEVTMTSDTGDSIGLGSNWHIVTADGKFEAIPNTGTTDVFGYSPQVRSVSIDFTSRIQPAPVGVGESWSWRFSTIRLGTALVPGGYLNAMLFGFEDIGKPGLESTGGSRICNTLTGAYTITDATFDCKLDSSGKKINHVKSFAAAFEQRCGGAIPALRGTISFADTTGVACDVVPGTPGTPGTPTPPSPFGFILPPSFSEQPLLISNSGAAEVPFTTAGDSTFTSGVSLAATSDADENSDFHVSISPSSIPAPGAGTAKVLITTGPNTFPRDYRVTIAATDDAGKTYYSGFNVSLTCDPPLVLGLNQPKSVSVLREGSAALSVTPNGTGPFSYQWFSGHSGHTNFRILGANEQTFRTSPIRESTDFWVRVSNACGSFDSQTATVTPTGPQTIPDKKRSSH